MDLQDLAYALNQIVHNFGAAAVTAGAACGRWLPSSIPQPIQRKLARLTLAGWAAQAASGATFGAISYTFLGQLPDIHQIAVAALLLKIACAVLGFALSALYLVREASWSESRRRGVWTTLLACALVALAAAAFLRWFS